jgi:uncharacterized protein (DUF488 family)
MIDHDSHGPRTEAQPIHTIGYGSRELDAFLDVLVEHGMAYLIDVRSRPYSRFRPEFTKQALEAHVDRRGLRYVYMGDTLGGRPDDRGCYTDDKVDYMKVRTCDFYVRGVARLVEASRKGHRVALMCSEGRPEQCHRGMLIGPTLVEAGIDVLHIGEEGQLLSQEQIELRASSGQLSLFPELTRRDQSRKRYRETSEDCFPV